MGHHVIDTDHANWPDPYYGGSSVQCADTQPRSGQQTAPRDSRSRVASGVAKLRARRAAGRQSGVLTTHTGLYVTENRLIFELAPAVLQRSMR